MAYTPKNASIANGLAHIPYQGLINFGQAVHDAMLTNVATFSSPSPPLSTLQTDISVMQTAFNNWGAYGAYGSSVDLNILREKRGILIADINAEAAYVLTVARAFANDFVTQSGIIVLAGMPVKSIPHNTGMFGQPQNLRQLLKAEYIRTGCILLRWKKPLIATGAKQTPVSYIVQQSPNGMDGWVQLDVSAKTWYLVRGLASGQSSFFRVLPVGKQGVGAASDPCSGMGQ